MEIQSILIQPLSVEELKAILNQIVSEKLEAYLKKEQKVVQYISRKDASQLLKCSLNTLDDWTVKGYLTPYRFGSTIRFKKCEVEEAGPNIPRRNKKRGNHA